MLLKPRWTKEVSKGVIVFQISINLSRKTIRAFRSEFIMALYGILFNERDGKFNLASARLKTWSVISWETRARLFHLYWSQSQRGSRKLPY